MELPNRATKDPYQEAPVKDFSYINNENKGPKKKGHRWVVITCSLVALVLLGIGAFAYGHYTKPNKAKIAKKTETHQTVTESKTDISSGSTATFTSSTFGLTVSYPKSWAVSTESNQTLNITSPNTTLVDDNGKSVNGRIIFSVFNQDQIPAGFGAGSLAVLNSQDLSFSNPTTSQAAQTYVSFVQYPATTVVGGMDAIYVTGNNGYVKGESITTAQVKAVSPLIIFSFEECKTDSCTNPSTLTISSSMWNNSSFQTPILNILKSLTFT